MREFTEIEKHILRLVQGTLPESATPYADIAAEVSRAGGETVSEEKVLALLRELTDAGAIRRFGATLRHQKAGWAANVMVAWVCPEEVVDPNGERMAGHQNVSHCYHRPPAEGWPYRLFTMVHGRSMEECERVVRELAALSGLEEYAMLHSVRELKKTSMTYF